jgi:hypothetical protein
VVRPGSGIFALFQANGTKKLDCIALQPKKPQNNPAIFLNFARASKVFSDKALTEFTRLFEKNMLCLIRAQTTYAQSGELFFGGTGSGRQSCSFPAEP